MNEKTMTRSRNTLRDSHSDEKKNCVKTVLPDWCHKIHSTRSQDQCERMMMQFDRKSSICKRRTVCLEPRIEKLTSFDLFDFTKQLYDNCENPIKK